MFFNSTVECDGSFVKMDSKVVKEMAFKTLERIKTYRAARKEKAIHDVINDINNGFWHKLLRLKPATREDAIAYLEGDVWNFDYHFTACMSAKAFESAERLLNACEHAEVVYISTEDLNRIS